MTEVQVGHLYSLASKVTHIQGDETRKLLRSYYLMKCREITKGYGLPVRHFSNNIRCPHCCLEWSKETVVKLQPITLSKRQRQRIKKCKKNNNDANKSKLQMEQLCTFCKHITITTLVKSQIQITKNNENNKKENIILPNSKNTKVINYPIKKQASKKTETKKNTVFNLYSNAFDVFSLNNKNNIVASTVKEAPKIIKNNKKKKDKFAGLCQQAVLTSAKLKQERENQEKGKQSTLSLFLKPST